MNNHALLVRAAAGGVGAAILLAGAGAAVAAQVNDDQVDVSVTITPGERGALTLSVADGGAALAEAETVDPETRSFTGTLPTVTVADDRSTVPAGVFWYVVGQASSLTSESGGAPIGPENLGWTPALLAGDDGSVAAGDATVPVLDEATVEDPANNVGLKGKELLAIAPDSADSRPTGTWKANAGLKLTTPADVAPGQYKGAITLTLWEDPQTTPAG